MSHTRFTTLLASSICFLPAALSANPTPPDKIGFEKIQLLDKYVSEGASMADVDDDGHMDVISGPLWWKGPDFKKSYSYAPVKFFNITGPGLAGYSNNFFTFPSFISKDKWIDIVKVGLPGQPAHWAKNPGEKPLSPTNTEHTCKHCAAQDHICNESPQLIDVIGDKKKELLAYSHNHITLSIPHPSETKKWTVYNISPKNGRFSMYTHGLGAADIDGDGLTDILEKEGWWQQPKNWDKKTPWTFHQYRFAPAQGGAQMYAYDIDGDGDNDVITALNAHKYGMAWYEQIKENGKISFKQHIVMPDNPNAKSPSGVNFSQPHAMQCIDIDGDGIKDIITGKCFFAHNGKDPGAHDPAVLYWFRTVRDKNGGAKLVPYLIDDNSGVGRQISVGDVNKDGKADIVVGNKKGVFVFLQKEIQEGEKKASKILDPNTFSVHGPSIKYGANQGKGFIGWWPKEGIASVPFTSVAAGHKGKKTGTEYHVKADIAAAGHAGGLLKIVLSENADPKKKGIKSWTVNIAPTGNWYSYKNMDLGKFNLTKAGKYFLHFIPEKPNREFINLSHVTIHTPSFRKFDIQAGKKKASKPKGNVKHGNDTSLEAQTPAEQLKDFHLPEGYVIELVSSDEQGTVKPISISFDDAGRLWTQTAREYPADKDVEQFRKAGKDQILVFDQPHKKGIQTPRIYADGLSMPVSVLPHDRGVIAVHGPDVLFFEDTDKDGKADVRKTLLSGFGIQDTHTTIHQLTRTPGGWINFSQGCNCFGTVTQSDGKKMPFNRSLIGRFRPNGTHLQVIGAGMNNIWAWAINSEGRTYIHEANDLGNSQVPFERDATYASFVKVQRYPDSIKHPNTAEGLGLGGTGFSGIAVSEDTARGYPKDWQNVHFVANPITGAINTVSYTIEKNGVHKFKRLEDLVTCDDKMFRPVAVEFGPDGCLYIIDWYNRIISHNEVSTDHPSRDKVSGRIWRVRHVSQTSSTVPNVEKAKSADLIKHLNSGNLWEMRAAWHQISKRQSKELIPQLVSNIRRRNATDSQRIHSLWCLESLGYFDANLWKELLASKNENVRYEAVRALSTLQPNINKAHALLRTLQSDRSFYVLNELVRFYRDTPQKLSSSHLSYVKRFKSPNSKIPKATVKGWGGPYLPLGGGYERKFLNILVDKVENRGAPPVAVLDEAKWNTFIDENPPKTSAEKAKIKEQIEHYLKVYEAANGKGDVAKGLQHYKNRCASCHNNDEKFKGFAPALNGGDKRDMEHLLTAIIDPNAAAEAVFNTYRVVKKDGSTVEGFRSDITPKEITIMFMGGSTIKIPMKDVKEAGYIKNKSVMLEGMMQGLSDKDAVDLLAYLKSLK